MKHIVAGFGEATKFTVATNVHDQNQFDGEWIDGNVVGLCHRSSEYLVISGNKILKGPTIRRRMASEAYKKECLDEGLL